MNNARNVSFGGAFAILSILTLPTVVFGSGHVTWGEFRSSPIAVGVPTTISLGGGSTVDVTITTGGTHLIRAFNFGPVGAPETGLDYDSLTVTSTFDGGGQSTVTTTIVYSNFQTGPNHVGGFLLVGGVNRKSSPITVTSVPGGVQTWPLVGSFDLDGTDSFPIFWNPGSGQFSTEALVGNDSRGIVVSTGDLAQYESITIVLQQHLDDTIIWSIGEETNTPTGVTGRAPQSVMLGAVYPNPFNPFVTIEYEIARVAPVAVSIFDVRGSLVRQLVDETKTAGSYSTVWNGLDDIGHQASSGIYFVRMTAGSHVETRKIVMLK